MTPIQKASDWLSRQKSALVWAPGGHAQIAAGAVAAAMKRFQSYSGYKKKIYMASYRMEGHPEFLVELGREASAFQDLRKMIFVIPQNAQPSEIAGANLIIIDEEDVSTGWCEGRIPKAFRGAVWLLTAAPLVGAMAPTLKMFEHVHLLECEGAPICDQGNSSWLNHDFSARGVCKRCGFSPTGATEEAKGQLPLL